VLERSWVLLRVAGVNDLDFYTVADPERPEILWGAQEEKAGKHRFLDD